MSSFSAGKTIDSPEKGKKKTLSNGGGNGGKVSDGTGVKSGLSERMALDTKSGDPKYDTRRNSLTGNATERRKPTAYKTVAGGFQIEE